VDHCQSGVFLTYASSQGPVVLDRELALPKEWTNAAARCPGAGVPAERPFAPKPQLAQQMRQRACDKGVPAAWGTGESVEGDKRSLRLWLEQQHHASVWAVSGKASVWRAGRQPQVKPRLAGLGTEGGCRLSAGAGAKGPRWYEWQWLALAAPRHLDWRRGLLVRRRRSDPTELTAYVVCAPPGATLATVVQVAGRRWTVERCFEEAKGEGGLDQYEGRSWTGWYRQSTLARGAYALLTVLRAAPLPAAPPLKKTAQGSSPSSLSAFKASRGLVCRCASARFGASFGVSCWPLSSA
jgi:SRSO17 transposase